MWIKLEDGTFAETPTPDPSRILTKEELQEELLRKQEAISMYEQEIESSQEMKTKLETEILDISNLLN